MTLDDQLQLILDSDLSASNKSGCRLWTFALYLLKDEVRPIKRSQLHERINSSDFPFSEYELDKNGKEFARWEVYFSTFRINYIRGGFIRNTAQGLELTEEGLDWLNREDPVAMLREARRRYRTWRKENPRKKKEIESADELSESHRIWLMAPGEGAELWDSFQRKGEASIGWDNAGDLAKLPALKDCTEKINALYQDGKNHSNIGRCLWEFAHKMQPGDIVVAKKGRSEYLGVGVVRSHYIWNEAAPSHKSMRKVTWVKTGRWPVGGQINQKTLTDVTSEKKYPGYKEELEATFELDFEEVRRAAFENGLAGVVEVPAQEGEMAYGLSDMLSEVFMSASRANELLDVLRRKKNIILQGPPGTGKTFIAKRLAYSCMKAKAGDRVEMVQFHQSYSYEDFIQGFRPKENGGFERRDGVFFRFCERARLSPGEDFFFVIDEINRGNLSKIFGELMMLVEADKRGDKHRVQLTYSMEGEHFSIPENVHIIGTMNTADRSLAMVDYALRRRFAFFQMPPQFNDKFEARLLENGNISEELAKRIVDKVTALNKAIADDQNLGPGFEIGHSYFCNDTPENGGEEAWYANIVDHEIGPQLQEYWFDDKSKAEAQIDLLKN